MRVLELGFGDLAKVVGKLYVYMKDYKNDLSQSELLTRYVLIDPLLGMLGWDVEATRKCGLSTKQSNW